MKKAILNIIIFNNTDIIQTSANNTFISFSKDSVYRFNELAKKDKIQLIDYYYDGEYITPNYLIYTNDSDYIFTSTKKISINYYSYQDDKPDINYQEFKENDIEAYTKILQWFGVKGLQ